MNNKFWAVANFMAGMCNLGLAIYLDSPKWFTLVCIGISFFVAGFFLAKDD